MPSTNAPDLSGLWTYPQIQRLDDSLAQQLGHTNDTGDPAPHGTYTPMHYFRIEKTDNDTDLILYDEQGNAVFFSYESIDSLGLHNWVSVNEGFDTTIAGPGRFYQFGTRKQLQFPAQLWSFKTTLLVLDRYDGTNVPSGAAIGDPYVRVANKQTPEGLDLPQQRLKYDSNDRTLTWSSDGLADGGDPTTLVFKPIDQPLHDVPGTGTDTFGDTFKGQTAFSQLTFPFFGYNPLKMNGGEAGGGMVSDSGTPPVTYNIMNDDGTQDDQQFNGTPIFKFPSPQSRDYFRAEDIPHQPIVPLGLRPLALGTEEDQTHTTMVSSVADQMRSWSVSLGLSAGVEGMFNVSLDGSYSSKVEEQQKSQSRLTVSRKVGKTWVMFTDIPSMALDDRFVAEIQSITANFLQGIQPDWHDFVQQFGTHYAHAITQGKLEYARTQFSLTAESTAHSQDIDLKEAASVTIEGGTAGENAEFKTAWADKYGIEISTEDIETFSIGKEFPMGIFFDLRPITELMSPVFFYEHNFADDFGYFSPCIWTSLRQSFAQYLETLGLNQPITNPAFLQDYTPGKQQLNSFSWQGNDDRVQNILNNCKGTFTFGSTQSIGLVAKTQPLELAIGDQWSFAVLTRPGSTVPGSLTVTAQLSDGDIVMKIPMQNIQVPTQDYVTCDLQATIEQSGKCDSVSVGLLFGIKNQGSIT